METRLLGATRQVTGSSYFLDADEMNILVDCGRCQERHNSYRNWQDLTSYIGLAKNADVIIRAR